MTRTFSRVVCFVLSLCGLLAGGIAYAQSDPINVDVISGYGLRNLPNSIVITATPANPDAGDTVHFTVEGSVYDYPKDTITWSVNGKRLASDVGVTSVDAKVDSRGNPLDVVVSVSDPVWGEASSELRLVPQQVDILYDAPTYVPPFYRGRSLPSAGSTMRLQAVARLMKNGSLVPNSSITYTWSRNGTVLGNLSGLGKSRIILDAPGMYGTDTITVRASAAGDTISASASIPIADTSPTLQLYEDHPLYGITFFNALQSPVAGQNDITVSAIPYFATITGLNDPSFKYAWSLNDAPLTASSTMRNEVTLASDHDPAKIHLDVTSSINFFLDIAADWVFNFKNSGGGSIQKQGTSDVFHNSNP